MKLEYVNCNLCGSNAYSIVYPAISSRKISIKPFKSSSVELGKDQIVKCKNCGLIYVNPRLKQKYIVKGYSEGSNKKFVSQAKGREITFGKSIRFIEKYVKKGRLLDVGTAGGSFLAVAKRHGWQIEGIEPNKWLCKWCKKYYGIDIKQGTLEKNLFENNSFDLVTLWDVLEHVPNPTATLKRVNRLLKKNGALVVNYPDIDSSIAKLMRRKWFFILTVHLYYFTPKTIRKLLEKCGFKVITTKKHWQTLSLGYLADRLKPYSNIGHKIATKTVKALHLDKMQIKYWLGQTFVIAKKVKEVN